MYKLSGSTFGKENILPFVYSSEHVQKLKINAQNL